MPCCVQPPVLVARPTSSCTSLPHCPWCRLRCRAPAHRPRSRASPTWWTSSISRRPLPAGFTLRSSCALSPRLRQPRRRQVHRRGAPPQRRLQMGPPQCWHGSHSRRHRPCQRQRRASWAAQPSRRQPPCSMQLWARHSPRASARTRRSPPCAAASQLAAARPSADAGRAAPFAFLLGDKQLQPRAAAAGLAAGPASSATPTHAALRPPPSSPQQAQQAQPSPSGPGASPASGTNVHRWVEQYRQRAAVAAAARRHAGAAATPGAAAGACSPPRPAARGQAARLPTADALAAAEAATLYPSPHVFWHSQPRQLLTHLAPLLAAEMVPLRAIMACSSMAGGVERVGWFILFEAAGVLGTLFLSMHGCMQLHLRSLDSKTAKGEGSRSCRGLALLFGFSGSTYVGTPCCAYRETRLHLRPSPLQPPSPAHPSTMQPSACITWALPCST